MSSIISKPVFSVPFNHRLRTHFCDDASTIIGQNGRIPAFVGDDSNAILQCFGSRDFQPVWPLVFFGPSGTGKTSLAMTVVSDLIAKNHRTELTSPIFLSASDFVRRFQSAIETNSIEDFRHRLFAASGIVIDDLHKVVEKSSAMQELNQVLENCIRKNLPIAFTLEKAPQDTQDLQPQLISRLTGGLVLPINPPGENARDQIIRELAKSNQLFLKEDAIQYLTNQLRVTVPKLVHVFAQIKLAIKADNHVGEIDSDKLLQLFKPSNADLEKLSQTIIQKIASSLHVEPSDMVGHCRQQSIVLARNIAIYLTRELLNFSFQKIGKSFGNRDHSTVMHSYRKIKKMLSDNRTEFANTISMIKSVRQEITEMLAGPNGLGDLKDVQSQSD